MRRYLKAYDQVWPNSPHARTHLRAHHARKARIQSACARPRLHYPLTARSHAVTRRRACHTFNLPSTCPPGVHFINMAAAGRVEVAAARVTEMMEREIMT